MPSLTRRRMLAGLGVLAAAAGGAVIGALTASSNPDDSTAHSAPPPAPLVSALERERTLLSAVHAAAANAALAGVTGPLLTDHSAHEATLSGLLATYPTASAPSSASSGSPSAPTAVPISVAALRTAEIAAAEAAAAESAAASGALAAVLASISACEASHAAWLR